MTSTLTWTVGGVSIPLTDANGYRVMPGVVGLDAPPVVNKIEDYTNADGAALAFRRRGVRQVVLPLWVRHPTRTQTRVHDLVGMLQGPGELAHTDTSGTRRLRNVIYEMGLDGDRSRANASPDSAALPGWRKFTVSLLALDPWWYGDPVTQFLPVGAPTAFSAAVAFSAVLPFNGGTSVSVSVAGDTDAYPAVTVHGPATSLVIGSAGKEWEIATALGASDVLVVDSRPGAQGPRLNGAGVDWSLLTAASRLWTLPPGLQTVVVGVIGSTGSTVISLEYSPRYLTP